MQLHLRIDIKERIRQEILRKAKRKHELMELFNDERARLEIARKQKISQEIYDNIVLEILSLAEEMVLFLDFAN